MDGDEGFADSQQAGNLMQEIYYRECLLTPSSPLLPIWKQEAAFGSSHGGQGAAGLNCGWWTCSPEVFLEDSLII